MDIYVYADESGVFDKKHNEYFVFGGLIFLSNDERCECSRLYSAIEKEVRKNERLDTHNEIKASAVTNHAKGRLYRSLNRYHKFGIVVQQKDILDSIFNNKKSKQRYLDYAFKIGLKRKLQVLIESCEIDPDAIGDIYVFVDEHTTATNGCYELREALEEEYKFGTHNYTYNTFYPPIFPHMTGEVQLWFKDSASTLLVRAADIVANRIYYHARNNALENSRSNKLYIEKLP